MGGSHSNTATINQSFANNITTVDQENCVSNANAQVSGNVLIVSGSTVSGNVGVIAAATTDASCLMVSAMENNIQDIMKATSTQTNNTSNDWFGGFEWNKDNNTFNLTQSVTNNISQINESTCTGNALASNNNNYVYIHGSTIGGNVAIASTTDPKANCSMTNMMKNYTYNYVQGDNNQSNTQKGMFVAIVSAICLLIGVIIIGVVILFAVGAIGFTGYELVKPKNSAGSTGSGSMDISSELSSLGLSTDDITSLDSQINSATPTISNIRSLAPTVTSSPTTATRAAALTPIGKVTPIAATKPPAQELRSQAAKENSVPVPQKNATAKNTSASVAKRPVAPPPQPAKNFASKPVVTHKAR